MSFKIHLFRYYICYLLVHCFIGLSFVLLPPLCSDVPPSHYLEWMKQGINIITPNKKLGSGPLEQYTAVKKVQRESYIHFFYEVGGVAWRVCVCGGGGCARGGGGGGYIDCNCRVRQSRRCSERATFTSSKRCVSGTI